MATAERSPSFTLESVLRSPDCACVFGGRLPASASASSARASPLRLPCADCPLYRHSSASSTPLIPTETTTEHRHDCSMRSQLELRLYWCAHCRAILRLVGPSTVLPIVDRGASSNHADAGPCTLGPRRPACELTHSPMVGTRLFTCAIGRQAPTLSQALLDEARRAMEYESSLSQGGTHGVVAAATQAVVAARDRV